MRSRALGMLIWRGRVYARFSKACVGALFPFQALRSIFILQEITLHKIYSHEITKVRDQEIADIWILFSVLPLTV